MSVPGLGPQKRISESTAASSSPPQRKRYQSVRCDKFALPTLLHAGIAVQQTSASPNGSRILSLIEATFACPFARQSAMSDALET
jgi:hypothetical protein